MSEPVTLVVSVDTEEDNWAPARDGITVENIRELPRLDRVFERLGVRPTYFTTYQVASTNWSAEIMRGLAASGRSEIGAHLHPWNTPPIKLPLNTDNTMLANLPRGIQREKISALTDALATTLGERPYSFRAGRWGLNSTTVGALIDCGYRVDSSVTPFKNWWRDHGPSHMGAPLNVYRLDGRGDHRVPVPNGPLIEVPLSWGYTHRPWKLLGGIHRVIDRPALRRMGMNELAARLHVINHVVLSPEIDSTEDMEILAHRLLDSGARHLHITFHSPTLRPGLSPFAPTASGVDRLYASLATLVERIDATTPVRFATVGEAATLLAPPLRRRPVVAPAGAPLGERRLLVVSYHFPPDPAIGGLRWSGLTKYLAGHGWRSWVVSGAAQPERTPSGVTVESYPRRSTLNDAYRRLAVRFTKKAPVRAADAGLASTPERRSPLARLRYEAGVVLALPDQARGWVLRAAWATRRLIERVKPTVIVSSGPPHSAHLAAWLATRFVDIPWFVDLRDPWAGPITDAWRETIFSRSDLARWLIERLERLVMRSATVIVCNTREFAVALGARYPGARIEWIPNAVDRALLPAAIDSTPLPGLGIAHVGTVYGGRDFGSLLTSLRAFLDRNPDAARDGTRLRIAGRLEEAHADALKRQIADLKLEPFVDLLGMLPRSDALQLVARSRLAVVLAQHQEFQVPGKLYEMIAMRVPTVVLASAESAASTEARRLGATALDPSDTDGLVSLMEQLRAGPMTVVRAPIGEIDYRQLATRVSAMLSSAVMLADRAPAAEPAQNPAA